MISFIRLQSNLFFDLESSFSKLLNLIGKNSFSIGSGVNAVGFDGENKSASVFKEMLSVYVDNSSLIRLRYIGENAVDKRVNDVPVIPRLSGVVNNRDNVGSFLSHVDQVSSGSFGVFYGVNASSLF